MWSRLLAKGEPWELPNTSLCVMNFSDFHLLVLYSMTNTLTWKYLFMIKYPDRYKKPWSKKEGRQGRMTTEEMRSHKVTVLVGPKAMSSAMRLHRYSKINQLLFYCWCARDVEGEAESNGKIHKGEKVDFNSMMRRNSHGNLSAESL